MNEANKVQLSISLGLIIALVSGSYYAGIQAGQGHGKATAYQEQGARTAEIETGLAKVVTILEHMAETQRTQGASISALESRTATLVTDVQVMQSKMR